MSKLFKTRDYDLTAYLVTVEDRDLSTVEMDGTGDVRFFFKPDATLFFDVEQFYHGGIFAKKLLDARRRVVRMSYALRHGQEVESR